MEKNKLQYIFMLFKSMYCTMARHRKNAKLDFDQETVQKAFLQRLTPMLSPNGR